MSKDEIIDRMIMYSIAATKITEDVKTASFNYLQAAELFKKYTNIDLKVLSIEDTKEVEKFLNPLLREQGRYYSDYLTSLTI